MRVEAGPTVTPVFDIPGFGGGMPSRSERRDRRGRREEPERPRRSLRPPSADGNLALAYEGREREQREVTRGLMPHQPLSVFPYGVSRTYLEQAVRELRLPVRIQHHVDDADTVLTLKNYYRRKDSPVRTAESTGIPIQVLRSNTVAQINAPLPPVYAVDPAHPTATPLQPP